MMFHLLGPIITIHGSKASAGCGNLITPRYDNVDHDGRVFVCCMCWGMMMMVWQYRPELGRDLDSCAMLEAQAPRFYFA